MSSTIAEMQAYAAAQKAADDALTEKLNVIRRTMADIGFPMSEDMSLSDIRKVFSSSALKLDTAPGQDTIDGITGYNRMPLLDAMMPSNAQYRSQSDPSKIVSGKQDPSRSNCFKTVFRIAEKHYDDNEVAIRIPISELLEATAKNTLATVYPKELIFINSGDPTDFMVYRNMNFGLGICQGNTMSNFLAIRTRHGIAYNGNAVSREDIDGDEPELEVGTGTYKSFWVNTKGQNLSYIDQTNHDMVFVMPDEDYAQELINSEWTVYCQYSLTAPTTTTNEPIKTPSYIYDLVQLSAINVAYLALAGKKDSRIWLGSDENTLMCQKKINQPIFENITAGNWASELDLIPMTAVTNKKVNAIGSVLRNSALTTYGAKSMDYTFGTLGKGTKWFVYSAELGAVLEPVRCQV